MKFNSQSIAVSVFIMYGRVARSKDDKKEMQRNIDKLMEWANAWQMDFNTTKCKVMHMTVTLTPWEGLPLLERSWKM